MSYVIDKNENDFKLKYYNVNIMGLDVHPKNNKNISFKAKKITIVDEALSNSYVKQKINKKINRLIEFMLKILNDDNTTEGDAEIVLDEISRLKGILFNKYKEHLKKEEYKNLISKIMLIEEDFKNNYYQKIYLNAVRNEIMMNNYFEDRVEGFRR